MSNCVIPAGRYPFAHSGTKSRCERPFPTKKAPFNGCPSKQGRKLQMSGDSPRNMRQSRIAAASGWIGSALGYYDFFIFATAASPGFPPLFFPSTNPTVAIVASLATYGVGYVARPIGAFVLGHWGDTHGRKNVLVLCMFLMGFSTMLVGLLADSPQ